MSIEPFENRIWLASPTMHGDEEKFVKEAFDTNWVSTVGPNIDELEKGMSGLLCGQNAVALSSGTAALHLAIRLAGIKENERVFCTDLTFDATVNPVSYEKGEQVFIDSEYDTWNMDPAALRKAFDKYPDCRIVIVVNLYGTPAKLDEIKEICREHGAVLIEDAAESLGAKYNGRETGTFGDYNVISFNGNKIITTSGGGMLLTESREDADRARKWSTQARDNAPWYQHSELGFNYRMSNILAGIGRGQLLHLEEHIAGKREIYERYRNGLKDLPVTFNPFDERSMVPNYWLTCMLIDKDAMCEQQRTDHEATYVKEHGKSCPTEILEELSSINAEGRPIWKPMHLQPIFKDREFVSCGTGTDIAGDIFNRGVCLPSDIKMSNQEQAIIIEKIRSCFD